MRTDLIHLCLIVLLATVSVRAQLNQLPPPAQGLDVVERLGERVPMDIELVDESGKPLTLGAYFQGDRPVVLVMGYYDCPLLCGVLFDGVATSFSKLSYEPGEDYQIVVVSFDHTNTTEDAFNRKQEVLETFGREITPGVRAGWAFHTTTAADARRLADAVGYQYKYQRQVDEYSHGAVIMMLTPEGELARYLFGLTFEPRDLKLALLEAADGTIAGGLGEYFLQRCFSWDPTAGGYALQAFWLMRVGSVLGAVVLAGFIALLMIGERRRAGRRNAEADRGMQASPAMGRM